MEKKIDILEKKRGKLEGLKDINTEQKEILKLHHYYLPQMSNLPPVVVVSSRPIVRSAVRAGARTSSHAPVVSAAPIISVAPAVSAASAAFLSSAAALAIANAEQKALEEKVRALEIRLAQIEALMIDTDSARGPGRGHGRNPLHVVSCVSTTKLLYYSLHNPSFFFVQRVVREAFQVAKNTYGLEFNQDFSMKDRLMNLAVYIKIIELSAEGIKALAGLAQTQTLASAVLRSLDSRIRNKFENARRAFRTAALPAFERQEHKDNDAKRKRLSRVSI